MASDKVVQNAVQTLNAELCHIRKVLERIAVALERQVEQIASLTPSSLRAGGVTGSMRRELLALLSMDATPSFDAPDTEGPRKMSQDHA